MATIEYVGAIVSTVFLIFHTQTAQIAPSIIDGMPPINAMDFAPVIPANEMNTYADTAMMIAQIDFIHSGGSSSSPIGSKVIVLTIAAVVVELLAKVTKDK